MHRDHEGTADVRARYLARYRRLVSQMDELVWLLKELKKLLQTIPEVDRSELLGDVDITELKEDLGPWFIADYPLYQGS